MDIKRIFKHLGVTRRELNTLFPAETLEAISQAVKASEKKHRGELRVIIEGTLPFGLLLKNSPARLRAVSLFKQQGVGQTREKSGVLIYLQVADRKIEILADSGISSKVPEAEWTIICEELGRALRDGRHLQGIMCAIDRITEILSDHFPANASNPNELPDNVQLIS